MEKLAQAPFHNLSLFRYLAYKFRLYTGSIEYLILPRDIWDILEERMLRILIFKPMRRLLQV